MGENFLFDTEEIFSVSRLTREIKDHLEEGFSSLWVEDEISNFRVPSSGHFYFTLKDAQSQIRVVMFRSRNQTLPFIPEDGMQVTCRASLSVYVPRGEYQLIAEWMEPRGHGALQLAFEALKRKLAEEGLFEEDRKKPLPSCPRVIGLITSPTGAAVQDILKVAWRRFPNLSIRFCPVRVQGDQAKAEIVDAIHRPIPCTSMDMIKKRIRPGMGRCQGGFCTPKILKILSRELDKPVTEITKNDVGSEMVFSRTKQLETQPWKGDKP